MVSFFTDQISVLLLLKVGETCDVQRWTDMVEEELQEYGKLLKSY